MRLPRIRAVATAAAIAGLALGSAVIEAGPAQAVSAIWNCTWVGPPGTLVAGDGCTGSGIGNKTGAGWLELNFTIEYRCNSFVWDGGTNPNALVTGVDCVVY